MGQLYSKLNQLVMNDVDTAADPERYREKLETAFTTPARVISVLLDDPRSATVNIDRTPIYVAVGEKDATETPKTAKTVPRPRYLETDLDDVLCKNNAPKSMVHSRILALSTSTPVRIKAASVVSSDTEEQGENEKVAANEFVDTITEDISDLRFSDTGICEVVTTMMTPTVSSDSEPANRGIILTKSCVSSADEAKSTEGETSMKSIDASYAEEVIIDSQDVDEISCAEIPSSELDSSLMVNWSGIGGQERSVGIVDQLYNQQRPLPTVNDTSENQFALSVNVSELPSYKLSDSMVVHNDSLSFDNHESDCSLQWDSMNDSLIVNSPAAALIQDRCDMDVLNKKNLLSTPQKNLLSSKPLIRTPLGDVSTNSPVISTSNHLNNGKLLMVPQDAKMWKNVRDERLKMGFDAENTPPPHSAFNSILPEVVQSAPGKLRTKSLKTAATKWSNNDSLLI